MTRYNDMPKFKYDYSVSCTRNKSFAWGGVRIMLDGDKISQKYVIKPVSYFKFNRSQSEERIFTNNETFPIFDYILQIDIIYFNESIINSATVTVPHPKMAARRFVLLPMVEIAPDYMHPILHKSNRILLKECGDSLAVYKKSN